MKFEKKLEIPNAPNSSEFISGDYKLCINSAIYNPSKCYVYRIR